MAQDIADLQEQVAFLTALASPWLVGCRAAALAQGWTVAVEQARLVFRHDERGDEYPVALPLPEDDGSQRAILSGLVIRLGYQGPTGLAQPRLGEDRRRLTDMPSGRAFREEDAA